MGALGWSRRPFGTRSPNARDDIAVVQFRLRAAMWSELVLRTSKRSHQSSRCRFDRTRCGVGFQSRPFDALYWLPRK